MLRIPRYPGEPPRYAACFDANAITIIKAVASAAAGALKARNTLAAGEAEQQAANARKVALDHQAEQARQQAGQERATSQRAAIERRRTAKLLESKALARAAASGAGAGDPTAEKILGDIGAEGEFRALAELFVGEDRARGLETQADLRNFEGRQEARAGAVARSASRGTAFSQVFSGLTGAFGVLDEGGIFDEDEVEPEKKTTTTAGSGRTLARFG